mmetsp:Transcript_61411/g.95338  ORF Transcript_61411/g.95338 Transcript_61411/m.95338 type:complete len:88 (+) Transcript_61411:241-504(+)
MSVNFWRESAHALAGDSRGAGGGTEDCSRQRRGTGKSSCPPSGSTDGIAGGNGGGSKGAGGELLGTPAYLAISGNLCSKAVDAFGRC